MLFLVMVMVPLARRSIEPPALGTRILGQVGRKFRPVAWTAIVLLVITGLYLATDRWGIGVSEFFGGESRFASVLQMKVGFVVLVIILSAIHDFVLGPHVMQQLESAREEGGQPSGETLTARRRVVWLARVNLLLVLIILGLSVTLIRGEPV